MMHVSEMSPTVLNPSSSDGGAVGVLTMGCPEVL